VTSNLVLVVIGSAVVLAAFGLAAGFTYGLSTGNVGHQLPRIVVATMAYLPAVLVMIGITMTLYGLVPKLSVVSWGALGAVVGAEIIGGTLQVSQSILNVSPFNHVPRALAEGLSLWPLASLTVVGLVLIGIGLIGFTQRSIG
jgi:ABC-2 type transport system permease protein